MKISRRGRSAVACLAVALAWLVPSSIAEATTLRRMGLPELVRDADRVVHARVVDRSVYWDSEGTRIYTDTVFEVLEEAKGKGPGRLTVTLLGGRIDPVEMTVDGTPTFALGEEVVLLTSPRPDGRKNLVGFSQGAMMVRQDPRSGDRFVVSESPAGVSWVEDPGAPGRGPRPARAVLPLEAFMENVRILAGGAASGSSGDVGRRPSRMKIREVKP